MLFPKSQASPHSTTKPRNPPPPATQSAWRPSFPQARESPLRRRRGGDFAKRRKLGEKFSGNLPSPSDAAVLRAAAPSRLKDHVRLFQRRGYEKSGAAAAPGGQREPREGFTSCK
ncbi:guanine nucleotide-binding protein G(I)/G(S)/G(O) subunit gamma-5 isoform X1 [Eublepharis macularius]|uniref:Guanine nucleotide-binding protein G(I)/G(S)/G(O) subunit gamma-5 isoform X1 n=1 Tax=Eublepharis macularius TaxID=481883 RepID=A0AA97JE94_EUBMA|nr:guanine nucleotide-binding protein G(I)/G(S)/G(O) subunit gamma-5 isoform X1 [Eublepharis macularius]